MKDLDKLDVKILKELLENSRMPLSKIGKRVRLSRENVYYRIKNLVQKKIIRDFITSIDYKQLGFEQNTIFLEFEKINARKEKEIIEYLHKKDNISWIGILAGNWSLTFDIYTKNNEELNKILEEFLVKFKDNVGEYSVLDVLDAKYYFNKMINESESKYLKPGANKTKINKLDVKILQKLNDDSRESYVNISEELKLTPNAIKQRVKNLEKSGLIQGYTISINHKSLGFDWHGLQIKLRKQSLNTEKNLKNYLETSKKVAFYYRYSKTGAHDFDIGITVKNSSELRDFINELRNNFYGEIKIYDIFLVLEEVSSQKLPLIVFE
jgi:Lrp/AsnC family leucine-responsive transcriptional regulator